MSSVRKQDLIKIHRQAGVASPGGTPKRLVGPVWPRQSLLKTGEGRLARGETLGKTAHRIGGAPLFDALRQTYSVLFHAISIPKLGGIVVVSSKLCTKRTQEGTRTVVWNVDDKQSV